MPRPRRLDLPDATYHVVHRGVGRRRIYFDDMDRIRFGELIGETFERFGTTILAYCLMDNHFHLIIHCPTAVLSKAMQHLGARYAEHVNIRYGRTGHLFGSRFHSSHVDSDRYRLTSLRYVERNSLDVRGVESPDSYRWSSVRSHLGYRTGPEWLDSDRVRSWFASLEGYRTFICDDAVQVEPGSIDLDHVDDIVDMMVHLHVEPDVSRTGLSRTVLLQVGDSLSDRNEQLVLDHLGLQRGRPASRALERSHVRSQQHPSVISAARATRAWLFELARLPEEAAA